MQQAFLAGLNAEELPQLGAQTGSTHISKRSKLDVKIRNVVPSNAFVQTESVIRASTAATDSEIIQHNEICSAGLHIENAPSPGIVLRCESAL